MHGEDWEHEEAQRVGMCRLFEADPEASRAAHYTSLNPDPSRVRCCGIVLSLFMVLMLALTLALTPALTLVLTLGLTLPCTPGGRFIQGDVAGGRGSSGGACDLK